MRVAAVVAEYNPFHNGHAYHLQKTREEGCSHIIAVMSGNFVQRGSIAIADKFLRAKAAVKGGADLVVELPLPWSASAAQDFADGAIQIVKATGITDVLSFGCENNSEETIQRVLTALLNVDIQIAIKENMQQGSAYPKAVADALSANGFIDECDFLSSPNNVLAVEYCKQLQTSDIKPLPIQRFGCQHDGDTIDNGFCSASCIRKQVIQEFDADSTVNNLHNVMPKTVADVYMNALGKTFPSITHQFDLCALARLRQLNETDFRKLPYVANGIEYRLQQAIKNATTFEEICDAAKNKQITHARIRRTLLHAALGLHDANMPKTVPYIRILAMNERGMQLLKDMKTKATLPVVMKYSDVKKLSNEAQDVFRYNQQATDFYSLCLPLRRCCDADATQQIYIEKVDLKEN